MSVNELENLVSEEEEEFKIGTVILPLPEDEPKPQSLETSTKNFEGFDDSMIGHSFEDDEPQTSNLVAENLDSHDIFGNENLQEFIIPEDQSKLDKKQKELSKLKKTSANRQPPIVITEEQTFEILSNLGIKETIDPLVLSKIDAAEMINIPFFINLREILCMYNIKSQVMDLFNVRASYTGYHEFIKGDRLDLPSVGFNSIAKSIEYSILQLPIGGDLDDEDRVMIHKLQEKFLNKVRVSIESKLIANSKIKDKNEPKKERQPESNDEFLKLIQSKNSGTAQLLNNNLDLVSSYGLSENAVFKDDTTDFSSLLVETKSFTDGINDTEVIGPQVNVTPGLYSTAFVSEQNFNMVSIDMDQFNKEEKTDLEKTLESNDEALLKIINSIDREEEN